MISRGHGWLVPILLISSILPMMFAAELGVRTCQTIAMGCALVSGLWVAWYGHKSLLDSAEILRRPLAWYEWVFDFALTTPRPFSSFMLVQMPWWALAHGALALDLARRVWWESASS